MQMSGDNGCTSYLSEVEGDTAIDLLCAINANLGVAIVCGLMYCERSWL